MRDFKQSEATAAYRRIYFRLISSADGVTPVTGKVTADFTLAWEKNGVTATPGGTITEVGSGLYYYEASAGDLDTKGSVILTPTVAGAYTFSYEGLVQANDFYTAPPAVPTHFASMLIDGTGKVTTGVTADPTGVTTLLGLLTAARAGNLDNLDAAISTRLAASGYTAAPTAAQNAAAVRDVFGLASSVSDAAPTASSFIGAAGLSAVDDFYKGMFLVFDGGALDGVGQKVTGYTGATRTFTVAPAFPATPANGDPFLLIGRG